MSDLADKFAALAQKAALGQNARSEVKLPEGEFGRVIDAFVTGLGKLDFLDCRASQSDADPELIHVTIAPRHHLTENGVLLTLWSNKINGKDAVSVIGDKQLVFTEPAGLEAHLEQLMGEDSVADWLSELKARYEGDTDGILRLRSLYNLTTDDAAAVVPHTSFLELAKAPQGEAITLRLDGGRSQVYGPDLKYKFLTSSGHVLEIASIAPSDDQGVVLVTGKKSSAVKRAA